MKQLEELSKEKAAFDLEEVEEIEEVGNEPLEELTGEIRLDRNKMLTQEPLTDFSNRTEHKYVFDKFCD